MKSRGIAILLLLLFGLIGGHKFYLGKVGTGVLYLIISLITFGTLGLLLCLIDLIILIFQGDKNFNLKYNRPSDEIK